MLRHFYRGDDLKDGFLTQGRDRGLRMLFISSPSFISARGSMRKFLRALVCVMRLSDTKKENVLMKKVSKCVVKFSWENQRSLNQKTFNLALGHDARKCKSFERFSSTLSPARLPFLNGCFE
jgi:hypothetical protein